MTWTLDTPTPTLDKEAPPVFLDGSNQPMPADDPSSRRFTQTATLWRATPDGYGGYTFAYPELINCRWEERSELLPGSDTEISRAIVYPDIAVAPEDYLFLGSSAAVTPVGLVGAFRVRSFSRIPNLRNLSTVLKCWLV